MSPRYHEPPQLPRQSTEPVGFNGTPQQSRVYSKYGKVEVLFLQWEADDLGVNTEIQKLNRLLRSHYNFTTYSRYIPSDDADDYLSRVIIDFRKGKGRQDLLIVYYGGHAAGSAGECTWVANRTPNSPTLNWLGVQPLLLEHSADVLLILDCCFSTLAARRSSMGDNWFLGSTAKESLAPGVSWKSFTSAMTRELERRADVHKANGQPFTVQSIHGSVTLWDRDLDVTPVITKLTDHECEPTDLTPLCSSPSPTILRLQSSPSAPLDPPLWHPSGSHLPQRPRVPGRDHVQNPPVPYSIVDALRDRTFSVRLSGLPASSTVGDIEHWLWDRLGQETIISRVAPLTTSQPRSTVVTFSSVVTARRALTIHDRYFRTQLYGEEATIRLDNDFLGLSCLYSSIKSPEGNPTVDLVFVHGTDGHAINSFASQLTNPIREALWPCTELPNVLEEAGIFPRIMTFGWPANVWLDPHQNKRKLGEAGESLLQELKRERSGCKNRPIVFVGHGVGGLSVKQAVVEVINSAFRDGDESFENPIKACFFFAVPHHSVNEKSGFASILAAMDSVVRYKKDPDFAQIGSLGSQNQAIIPLSREFDVVRTEYRIHIQCFYEAQPTSDMYVVPKESAMLDLNPESSHRVDANFRDILQLDKSGQNLRQVLDIMRDAIQKKLGPKPARKPGPKKENVYPRLQAYDTVFLVDDSDSMAGPRWSTTSKVLAKIAKIAVLYDKDGVDVRFFNTYLEDEERLNLNSFEKVMELFKKVTPSGPTPTADLLEDELNLYLVKLREKRNRKRLNLIVLTDGEPDDLKAVEEVIVKYANELKELRAHSLQVGVQFVQIGGDKAASKFLRGLDDDLMKKRNLDRDMVDTVLWNDDDEDWLYEKILLGGILRRLDDDNGH